MPHYLMCPRLLTFEFNIRQNTCTQNIFYTEHIYSRLGFVVLQSGEGQDVASDHDPLSLFRCHLCLSRQRHHHFADGARHYKVSAS